MNTLGASLASFRSATETPAGRAPRDDENPAAFGTVLGALSEERPPEPRDTPADAEAEAQTSALPALPAPGDTASALAMLTAIEASAAASAPVGSGVKTTTDTIGTLIARAATAANGPTVPGSGPGRLQVTVLAQETHFAPVKPHQVGFVGAGPAAPSIAAGALGTSVLAESADPGIVQATVAPSSPQVPRLEQVASLSDDASHSGFGPSDAASPGGLSPSTPKTVAAVGSLPSVADTARESTAPGLSAGIGEIAAGASASGPRRPGSTDSAAVAIPPVAQAVPSGPLGHAAPSNSAVAGRHARGIATGETARTASKTMADAASPGPTAARDDERSAVALTEVRQEIGQPTGSGLAVSVPSSSAGEPSRQVASAVLAQVARMPANAEATLQAGLDGPLRILTIQLRPDDLGTVLVRMRLRGDQLEMSLHASREETAALLRSDAVALDGLLRSAGYQPDIVTIGSSRIDAPLSGEPSRAGAGSTFDGPGQDAGSAVSDQSGRREPDRRDAERRNIPWETNSDETTSAGPGRIGRYL